MTGLFSIHTPGINFRIETGFNSQHFPNLNSNSMERNRIAEGFKQLERAGWTDLIDKRWKGNVIAELKNNVLGITEEEIQEILSVVLW